MIEPSATFQNAKIDWKEKHRLIWACINIVVNFRVQMASCWKNALWPSCIVFFWGLAEPRLGKKQQTVAGFSTFAGRPSQPLRWRDFASPKFGLSPVKWRFWSAYGACMYTSVNSLPHCKLVSSYLFSTFPLNQLTTPVLDWSIPRNGLEASGERLWHSCEACSVYHWITLCQSCILDSKKGSIRRAQCIYGTVGIT